MLSLDGDMRYWLYDRPVDMRRGFGKLSTIACELMGHQMRTGDVFIFVGARRNMMKILHHEDGFLVMYSVRMDIGRVKLRFEDLGSSCGATSVNYEELVRLIESAARSSYVRRVKMLARNLQESEKIR